MPTSLSHPSRVRELKRTLCTLLTPIYMSHPSRVRELKLEKQELDRLVKFVAPLPGA